MKKLVSLILALTMVLSLCPAAFAEEAQGESFVDVPKTAWYYDSVTECADRDVVHGVGNDEFAPDKGLTYAELAMMVCNAFGVDTKVTDGGMWYEKAMQYCTNKLYVADGVDPNTAVTREAAADFLYRAFSYCFDGGQNNTVIPGSDSVNTKYLNSVKQMYANGIIAGVNESGDFMPTKQFTRAEFCAVLSRTFPHKGEYDMSHMSYAQLALIVASGNGLTVDELKGGDKWYTKAIKYCVENKLFPEDVAPLSAVDNDKAVAIIKGAVSDSSNKHEVAETYAEMVKALNVSTSVLSKSDVYSLVDVAITNTVVVPEVGTTGKAAPSTSTESTANNETPANSETNSNSQGNSQNTQNNGQSGTTISGDTATPSDNTSVGSTIPTGNTTPTGNTAPSNASSSVAPTVTTRDRAVARPVIVSDTFAYDGTRHTPEFLAYNENYMTVSGDTSATEAGEYTVTFVPKAHVVWGDNTVTLVTIKWYIVAVPEAISIGELAVIIASACGEDTTGANSEEVVAKAIAFCKNNGYIEPTATASDEIAIEYAKTPIVDAIADYAVKTGTAPSEEDIVSRYEDVVESIGTSIGTLTVNDIRDVVTDTVPQGVPTRGQDTTPNTVTETTSAFVVDVVVSSQPNKTTYTEGESFDVAGLVISAVMSDGTRQAISHYNVVNGRNLSVGTGRVEIEATVNNITYTLYARITVNAKPIETNPDTPNPTPIPTPTPVVTEVSVGELAVIIASACGKDISGAGKDEVIQKAIDFCKGNGYIESTVTANDTTTVTEAKDAIVDAIEDYATKTGTAPSEQDIINRYEDVVTSLPQGEEIGALTTEDIRDIVVNTTPDNVPVRGHDTTPNKVEKPTAVTVTGVEVTTPPNKLAYQLGESFDVAGMVISAVLSDGSRKTISHYNVVNGRSLNRDSSPIRINTTVDGTMYNLTVNIVINGAKIPSVPTVTGEFTYTGNEQTPVIGAYDSTLITVSGDTTATSVGTYTITFTPNANCYWWDGTTAPKTATWSIGLVSANLSIAPAPIENLVYTGVPQTLIAEGNASDGTLKYKLEDGEYDTALPTATDAGTYTVWYKVFGDSNHHDSTEQSISVTIAPMSQTYVTPALAASVEYDGNPHTLLATAGSAEHGAIEYSVNGGAWSTTEPTAATIGDYEVSYRITGNRNYANVNATVIGTFTIAKNLVTVPTITSSAFTYDGSEHTVTIANEPDASIATRSGVTSATDAGEYTITYTLLDTDNYQWASGFNGVLTWEISKVDPEVSAPTANTLTYNGSEQALITAGSVTGGTMQYSLDGSSWDTSIPNGTNAGSYTVYYKVVGDGNHNDSVGGSVSVTIANGASSLPTPPTANTLTYNGSAQELVSAGVAENGTIQYSLSNEESGFGTAIPTATDAGDYTVYYRVVGAMNYDGIGVQSIAVSIAKASLTVTAKDQTIDYGGAITTGIDQITVTGLQGSDDVEQITLTANTNDVPGGVITPSGAVVKCGGNDVTGNYTIAYTNSALTINKVAAVLTTAPAAISGLEYDGTAKTLITAGEADGGVIKYKLGNGEYGTTLPVSPATDAGTYTVYYRVDPANENYEGIAETSFEVTVSTSFSWTENNGEITITGLTDAAKAQYTAKNGHTPEGDITAMPDTIGGKPITIISNNAFRDIDGNYAGCSALKLTSLPSGLTSIQTNAFYNCRNLALTSLPSGITSIENSTFSGCINLALTELPSGVTSIGVSAFQGCPNLALTSLPSGVTSIGKQAFCVCPKLVLTSLPSGVTDIEDYAFDGCTDLALTSLPSGVTSIGNYAFHDCTNLALTALPSGVTSIGSNAFNGCTSLALTSLPSGVTSIENSTFSGCTNLALTELPSDVTSIGSNAFDSCTNLALTELPSGVTSIGNCAFYGCTNLALTSLPSGVTSIGSGTFYNCTNLALTELPSGVTRIEDSTFYNCTNLALTELPSGVTSIGNCAFYGCTNLALTSLPSGVTSIGSGTFYNCTNLALTELPSGVTSIGGNAFYNCTNLALTELPSGVTRIGGSAFYGCTNVNITHVPCSYGNYAFEDTKCENPIVISQALSSAQNGIEYTDGLSDLTDAQISEIAKAISNNPAITSDTTEVWINGCNRHISIGDTISYTMDGTSYAFRVMGFNHYALTSATAYGSATTTGKAGILMQMVNCFNTKAMKSSMTSSDGWHNSDLRTWMNGTMLGYLPSATQSAIKQVNISTAQDVSTATLNTTADKLFLPAEVEVFGTTSYAKAGTNEGTWYAWYKANNTVTNRVPLRKVNGSAAYWWGRSPYSWDSDRNRSSFCYVTSGGYTSDARADNSYGVAPCFCY